MARPRQFDEAQVREAALAAFLEHGYEAASLSILEDTTGLGRRSLYNSFGDKRTLFLSSLEAFRDLASSTYLVPLEAPDASPDTIGAVLNRMAEDAATPLGRYGCLICNTAREPVAADPDVAKQIHAYFDRIKAGFTHALKQGQQAGRLTSDADIGGLATFFLSVLISVCVMARAGFDVPTLKTVVHQSLKNL